MNKTLTTDLNHQKRLKALHLQGHNLSLTAHSVALLCICSEERIRDKALESWKREKLYRCSPQVLSQQTEHQLQRWCPDNTCPFKRLPFPSTCGPANCKYCLTLALQAWSEYSSTICMGDIEQFDKHHEQLYVKSTGKKQSGSSALQTFCSSTEQIHTTHQ